MTEQPILMGRKWFFYLVEIFLRVAFRIREMIQKMSPEGRVHFISGKEFQKMFLDPGFTVKSKRNQ